MVINLSQLIATLGVKGEAGSPLQSSPFLKETLNEREQIY